MSMLAASPWLAALLVSFSLFAAAPHARAPSASPAIPVLELRCQCRRRRRLLALLESRGFTKRSDALEDPSDTEETHGYRLDLYASWTPLDRLTLTLDVRSSRIGSSEPSAVSTSARPCRGSETSRWPPASCSGAIAPSASVGRGPRLAEDAHRPRLRQGGRRDRPASPARHRLVGLRRRPRRRAGLEWGSLYGSILRRWNTLGALDYRYGNVWLATLGVEAPLGHLFGQPALDFLTPGLGLTSATPATTKRTASATTPAEEPSCMRRPRSASGCPSAWRSSRPRCVGRSSCRSRRTGCIRTSTRSRSTRLASSSRSSELRAAGWRAGSCWPQPPRARPKRPSWCCAPTERARSCASGRRRRPPHPLLASWCPECVRELPELERAAGALCGGLTVAAVNWASRWSGRELPRGARPASGAAPRSGWGALAALRAGSAGERDLDARRPARADRPREPRRVGSAPGGARLPLRRRPG